MSDKVQLSEVFEGMDSFEYLAKLFNVDSVKSLIVSASILHVDLRNEVLNRSNLEHLALLSEAYRNVRLMSRGGYIGNAVKEDILQFLNKKFGTNPCDLYYDKSWGIVFKLPEEDFLRAGVCIHINSNGYLHITNGSQGFNNCNPCWIINSFEIKKSNKLVESMRFSSM